MCMSAYLIDKHANTKNPKKLHVRPATNHLYGLELPSAVHAIVEDDLDQIRPPDHLGRVYEVFAEQSSHAIANTLGGDDENKRSDSTNTIVEEKIGSGQDIDGVCRSSSSRDSNSNKSVLFDVEWSRVEGHAMPTKRDRSNRETLLHKLSNGI